MPTSTLDEQLNAYLADAFRTHLDETEGHLRRVRERERLEARGGAPSRRPRGTSLQRNGSDPG